MELREEVRWEQTLASYKEELANIAIEKRNELFQKLSALVLELLLSWRQDD